MPDEAPSPNGGSVRAASDTTRRPSATPAAWPSPSVAERQVGLKSPSPRLVVFTAHVSASDISVSSSDIRGRWYTMVSITLAKDKESFGMLPSLIESLKHSGSVPSRALLAACIKSCTEMGDAKMETQMRKLLLQCGYS